VLNSIYVNQQAILIRYSVENYRGVFSLLLTHFVCAVFANVNLHIFHFERDDAQEKKALGSVSCTVNSYLHMTIISIKELCVVNVKTDNNKKP
jgi:hypothetical protein